jgi:hypothetical protein
VRRKGPRVATNGGGVGGPATRVSEPNPIVRSSEDPAEPGRPLRRQSTRATRGWTTSKAVVGPRAASGQSREVFARCKQSLPHGRAGTSSLCRQVLAQHLGLASQPLSLIDLTQLRVLIRCLRALLDLTADNRVQVDLAQDATIDIRRTYPRCRTRDVLAARCSRFSQVDID